ncbi:hypothetical protein FJTKL_03232 [Diaporthe vaccinii]|uniref:Uncharacterized protein n=1 Tax=Diaporthe vaccinii TaxID=105482 RepID=A0ABR4DVK3_9PEZI
MGTRTPPPSSTRGQLVHSGPTQVQPDQIEGPRFHQRYGNILYGKGSAGAGRVRQQMGDDTAHPKPTSVGAPARHL